MILARILAILFIAVAPAAAGPPNFLVIMADDCTFNDLPLYGGQNAKTPNIDALAARGLTFNQAYLCSSMCQPCRAELYTGLYPMSNGCAWNHSASRPETQSLPHHLGSLDYRVGLAGKTHVKPVAAFPFEKVAGFDPSCVREPTQAHDLAGVREFITRDTENPFCLVIALVEPHVPWVMGDASQYPPKKIKLPPNLADTPVTREHFANYLAEITYMDGQVGEILETLEESGRSEETIILFTSEQGSQFPGCKWTNWNTGVHTALIAAWPGKIPEGKRTDALVQYADVAPTLVDLAGGEFEDETFDGSSFAAVLTDPAAAHREFVYHMHNNLPEGPAYPIRSVSDGEFHYLRNLRPDELYIEKHLMGGGRFNNPYWATWVGAQPEQTAVYELVKRYMRRPAEQLYQVDKDSYELTNLAENPQHAERLEALSTELDRWMEDQGDPGIPIDTQETLKAARKGVHEFGKN
ncbi:MAG: N-sulfoglucosamine sulfohydrolase [Verrucomicrobiales bacterium]|jgi:N-sulfoglucosamine sulfohydrolase